MGKALFHGQMQLCAIGIPNNHEFTEYLPVDVPRPLVSIATVINSVQPCLTLPQGTPHIWPRELNALLGLQILCRIYPNN